MKKIFLLVLLSAALSSYGQWTPQGGKNRWMNGVAFGIKDTSSYTNPGDTGILIQLPSGILVYRHLLTDHWSVIATTSNVITPADTASMLANRLKISDTAHMLSFYTRGPSASDSLTIPVFSGIDGKSLRASALKIRNFPEDNFVDIFTDASENPLYTQAYSITVTAKDATGSNVEGGYIALDAGNSSNGKGGNVLLAAGLGGASTPGGNVYLIPGQGHGSATLGQVIISGVNTGSAAKLDIRRLTLSGGEKTFYFPDTSGTFALTSSLNNYLLKTDTATMLSHLTLDRVLLNGNSSGRNFSAGTITANLNGNATTATTATSADFLNITLTTANSTYYLPFIASNLGTNVSVFTGANTPTLNPSNGNFGVTGSGTFGDIGYFNASSFTQLRWTRTGGGGKVWALASDGNGSRIYNVTDNIEAFTITNAGNVGIGTTSPSNKFVVSNAGATGLEIDPVTGDNGGVNILSYSRSGAVYKQLSTYANNYVLNTSSVNNALVLLQGGNVGIGTTSPQNLLHVAGVTRISNASGGSMLYMTHGATSGNTYSEIDALINSGAGYGDLILQSGGGSVGIGTTTPSSVNAGGYNNTLVVSSTGNANGITIEQTSTQSSQLRFGDGGSSRWDQGYIAYDHSTDALSLGANRNTGLIINSSQQTLLTSGQAEVLSLASSNASNVWQIFKYNTSTTLGYIGSGAGLVTGGSSSDFIIRSEQALKLATASGTVGLTIAANQTATFSSLGTGTVYSNSGTLTNTNPSDRRLKNTIQTFKYGLKELNQLQAKSYYFNSDSSHKFLKYGFIAQDIKNIMPDFVRPLDGKGLLGLESEGFTPLIVNSIQQQQRQIDELKKEVKKLKLRK